MSGSRTKNGSEREQWRAFAARWPGDPRLAADPLYALPEALIDILGEEVRGLIPDGAKAFERDLSVSARGGLFFRQRAIPCLLLEPAADEKLAEIDAKLRDATGEELEGSGVSRDTVKAFEARQAVYEEKADLRAAAYAGWLVSNTRFLDERDVLELREGRYVTEHDRFPCLGEWCGKDDRENAMFQNFYRRWGLYSFLTWDLPLPLRPEIGLTTLDATVLKGAGVHLFLPWYVAEDGRFSADDLARHLKTVNRPGHIKGWLTTPAGGRNSSGREKALGDVRYRHFLVLYRYWVLVLMGRYADRLARRTMKLDIAFGRYLDCDAESVKKVRLAASRAAQADRG